MIRMMRFYVRAVDMVNYRIGRLAMYGLFVMATILLWSSISKTFFLPSLWTLEAAQFAMVAYYILGGPYSIQLGSNVRMDLFYEPWTVRRKAWVDAFTVLFLIFFLGVLFYGAVGSAAYSLGYFGDAPFSFLKELVGAYVTGGSEALSEKLGYMERSSSAWRPPLWPIKLIMCLGFLLMLLQAISELFKDIITLREGDADVA